MSVYTSSRFASAAASGTDWRDTARKVLEDLESIRSDGQAFNFGFLYVSDHLAEDAQSILNLFKSVLNVDHWVGGVGIGLCGVGESYIDVPAISALIGCFDPDHFCMIPPLSADGTTNMKELTPWLKSNEAMLTFVHGDPMADQDPALTLGLLEDLCGGFVAGGLTSSRRTHAQFSDECYNGSLCGAVFSSRVPVASTLSQGCNIISDLHTITRADGHSIMEIDCKRAVSVFENDIRIMTIKATGLDPDTIKVDEEALHDKSQIPEDFHAIFSGEVHAALPISQSDQGDYLVRNIIGLDADRGTLTIAQHVHAGDRIIFVHRDHESVYRDLKTRLETLRARVTLENGGRFEPKAAIFISCVARAFNQFEHAQTNEMVLIREIIGNVPLAGFYAGGEISKARLYGYTGILTLFL
jgi:small ligand-binding sensory domain FIST